MAKKKSGKKNTTSLVVSLVVLALAVLVVCTLFMPVFKKWTTATEVELWTAKGTDVFAAAFAGEVSLDMSAGTKALYLLKAAEDTAFVAVVGYWAYMLLVIASAGVIVTSVLRLLGINLKLVDTIFGACVVVLALVAFIFAFVIASKASLGESVGSTCVAHVGMYFACICGLASGAMAVYRARN